MISIRVEKQILYHRRKTGVIDVYPISTASKGMGNQEGSYQTPLGKHKIYAKIGEGCPKETYFEARKPKGLFTQETQFNKKDWILSRIIWLTGVQTGVNKRGKVDSQRRYIYIHGTNEEGSIGQPASHGCIRMKNDDVIDLFNHVWCGESVYIKP
ncbi:MAG: L,D-transpeptidase [Ghiorsea sp.]|nr:L,D-transpeptidase [Ghiorsea sp.]